ncbi:uncharacterized protein LOC143180179 [Calliopsis andreniformis]|uniref:uncharacterized protein LOC143180179 n=1 Tax=Calliopsis andreniformis TaxID=337506 RepID=UPI003FCDA605
MYKSLLILVALSSPSLCDQEINMSEILSNNRVDRQIKQEPSSVQMTGYYNYHAAQQIFFMNGAPQKWNSGFKNCLSYLERDDYTITPDVGVHKLHPRKLKWNQARKACMEEGGHLVILNSEREERILLDSMKKENISQAWLGVHDQFEEADWVTLTGQSLDAAGYDKWSTVWPNQPDNYGGKQNCGVLEKGGGIDDIECDFKFPFFCEIEMFDARVFYCGLICPWNLCFCITLAIDFSKLDLEFSLNLCEFCEISSKPKACFSISAIKKGYTDPQKILRSFIRQKLVFISYSKKQDQRGKWRRVSLKDHTLSRSKAITLFYSSHSKTSLNCFIFLVPQNHFQELTLRRLSLPLHVSVTKASLVEVKFIKSVPPLRNLSKPRIMRVVEPKVPILQRGKLDCAQSSMVDRVVRDNERKKNRRWSKEGKQISEAELVVLRLPKTSGFLTEQDSTVTRDLVDERNPGCAHAYGRSWLVPEIIIANKTMILLFLLCLLEGVLYGTLVDSTVDKVVLEEAHDFKERWARSAPDEFRTRTVCQNVYEANQQMFHVNGKPSRKWNKNDVPLTQGYVLTRGIGAHKFHKRRIKWNAARKICMSEGGNLAVLNSLAEESVLLDVMQQNNVDRVWVGIHDIFKEGQWITITGETIERAGYNKWSTVWPNQPDNYGGRQNCGVLEQGGGIDDAECDLLYGFFCEIDVY